MERIAHRGAKREFPENTLPAFARAFERGADAVELDVHATRDGVVVVHHDPRLSAPLGRGLEIADADWEQIRAVDLGGGIGIPRLVDVLLAAPSGRTVYVEIKGRAIEQLVTSVIRECDTHCAVHSFDHDAIVRMRLLAPEIPRGVLLEDRGMDVAGIVQRTGARDVWPHWKLIDDSLVRAVHTAGARVIAWTVNDEKVAARLSEMGVEGLCGDDVRLFDAL